MPHAHTTVRGVRVLLVDDHEDTVHATSILLQLRGHQVYTAMEGLRAVEIALQERPDVVILDIGLPGMNGYEIAARLRAEPGFDGTHLIALSGYERSQVRARAHEAGFDDHLTKPVDYDVLFELIEGRSNHAPTLARGRE